MVSQYCNSPQVHYIIDELMSANIPFVLVTAAEKAWPYDKFAQVTLRISCTESRYKMGSFASRNAFLYLLDCLYGTMFSLNYEQNKQNLSAFPSARWSAAIITSISRTRKRITESLPGSRHLLLPLSSRLLPRRS